MGKLFFNLLLFLKIAKGPTIAKDGVIRIRI
jgi:hypothetical protein